MPEQLQLPLKRSPVNTQGFDRTNGDIVAMPDIDPNQVGAFVWWHLHGNLNVVKLEQYFKDAGINLPLPKAPSAAAALRRACNDQKNKRRMARTLADDRTGYAIVDEDAVKVSTSRSRLTYEPTLEVWLDKDGHLAFDPMFHSLNGTISDAYRRHLESVEADDTRTWLKGKLLSTTLGVALRDGGGVYFVPQQEIKLLRSVVIGIKHCSAHKIFAVPAARGEDAVEGILDAIRAESDKKIEELREALLDPKLGHRALQTKADEAKAAQVKLSRYENLLGVRHSDLGTTLSSLQAHLMEAVFRAKEKKEKK